MNFSRWIFAYLMTFGASVTVFAQVVECVDADGNKVYMQSCPSSMTKKRDIEAPPPISPKAPSAKDVAAQKSLADQEKAFEQRRAAQKKAQADAEAKAEKAKQDAATCAEDKRRLELLGLGKAYKRVDPTTGVPLPVDDDERQSEINSLNAKIAALGDACQ